MAAPHSLKPAVVLFWVMRSVMCPGSAPREISSAATEWVRGEVLENEKLPESVKRPV